MTYMMTYSGVKFYPGNPKPDMIRIEDIAHALSCINRFGGHAVAPYSVAQHSVLCSLHVEEGYELEALLHDATEAYIADVVTPAKDLLPGYKELEARIWRDAIAPTFGLSGGRLSDAVKLIDHRMLVTEARALLRDSSWTRDPIWPEPVQEFIRPWSPHLAETRFLLRFKELTQ